MATFLSVLFCLLSLLISDSRFDLVWFRLSCCDHGWIRSGSVSLRKTTNNNTKFDFTVDEGKKLLNPSRDKNQGTHRRRKVD